MIITSLKDDDVTSQELPGAGAMIPYFAGSQLTGLDRGHLSPFAPVVRIAERE